MNEKSTREWIAKADRDLKIGKDEFVTEGPATDMICFHMQQYTEKYLKAFLIFNSREIRRTHIVEELIRECIEIDSDFQQLFEIRAHTLTDFAVELRYPSDVSLPSHEETKEAIDITEKVKQFILDKLKDRGFVTL